MQKAKKSEAQKDGQNHHKADVRSFRSRCHLKTTCHRFAGTFSGPG
jgi:hypothetical protein